MWDFSRNEGPFDAAPTNRWQSQVRIERSRDGARRELGWKQGSQLGCVDRLVIMWIVHEAYRLATRRIQWNLTEVQLGLLLVRQLPNSSGF